MCAKWVPKLWMLSEKVRIFDKTKWAKSEGAKSEFPQITVSSMELFFRESDGNGSEHLINRAVCPWLGCHYSLRLSAQLFPRKPFDTIKSWLWIVHLSSRWTRLHGSIFKLQITWEDKSKSRVPVSKFWLQWLFSHSQLCVETHAVSVRSVVLRRKSLFPFDEVKSLCTIPLNERNENVGSDETKYMLGVWRWKENSQLASNLCTSVVWVSLQSNSSLLYVQLTQKIRIPCQIKVSYQIHQNHKHSLYERRSIQQCSWF